MATGHPVSEGRRMVGVAVVEDPEDARGGAIGLPGHHLVDEPIERDLRVRLGEVTEDLPPGDVDGGEVGDRLPPSIFVFDTDRVTGRGRLRRVRPLEHLDAGLLVGRKDILVRAEGVTLPSSVIEVDHRFGPLAEEGIARELPVAILPRAQGIGAQPSSDRGTARRGAEFACDLPGDVGMGEAAQRYSASSRELTSEGDDTRSVEIGVEAGSAGARSVFPTVLGAFDESSPPKSDGGDRQMKVASDGGVALSARGEENDPGALDGALRGGSTPDGLRQLTPLVGGEAYLDFGQWTGGNPARHPVKGCVRR